ncbi:MAG: 2-amino-4-hydroxy-6-hydroxymethyldihydropteridine diphosphokinase [Lachnospiraceae bacterium]|nr:2-amino-4-hydroxy-6-hydroxymethyldihydropteridine diphosphokinase [Lachnospiraceae bacterium]
MDCIEIKNLEVYGYHGVYEEEKKLGQKFVVCADLYLDTRPAGLADDLSLSVHYGEVCKFINDFMSTKTYYLIEAAAEELAKNILLNYSHVNGLKLKIMKPWAPIGLHLDEVSVTIERSWHDAYISIGSNVGRKRDNIDIAIKRLQSDDDIRLIKRSSLIETTPYGFKDQDDFLNGALHIKTLYTPYELLKCLNEIELLGDRTRDIKWGPRTIDLDILFYDDLILDSEELTIPHVDMQHREFVLKPLNEIAPNLRHPLLNKTIGNLLGELILLS